MRNKSFGMKQILFLAFTIYSLSCFAQPKSDIGLFIGAAQYWGDLNSGRIINSPDVAGGLIYRYNIDKRYAVRFNANYTSISANDVTNRNYGSMEASILNFALLGEFNFLPIETKDEDDRNAMFLTAGIGYSYGIKLSPSHFCIPFGFGYKHYLTDKLGLTLDIGFRKTFTDEIDGVYYRENSVDIQTQNKTLFNNNDWYTFAGISITYKFFNARTICPVYDK